MLYALRYLAYQKELPKADYTVAVRPCGNGCRIHSEGRIRAVQVRRRSAEKQPLEDARRFEPARVLPVVRGSNVSVGEALSPIARGAGSTDYLDCDRIGRQPRYAVVPVSDRAGRRRLPHGGRLRAEVFTELEHHR